jgi:hypothetical protein
MSDRHLIGRRQFLAVSSTCAVAAATLGPKLFAGAALSSPKRLAVGFASFEENAAVTAATGIPAADGGFIGRGARITTSGASGAPVAARARRGVELLAHFPYFDGAERRSAPFRAWGCSRITGCQGNSVGFNVPVDDVQKITFTIGAETGAPRGAASRRDAVTADLGESTALPLTLSLQGDGGSFKLARGFYVVVPVFEGDAEPSWSGYMLRVVEGRWTLVDAEGRTAPFEHFVLKVDYANL